MESASPRGRVVLLEAIARGEKPSKEGLRQLDECLDCRACEAVCPAHVPVGHRVDDFRRAHRNWISPSKGAKRVSRWLASPMGLRGFHWAVRQSQRPVLARLASRGLPLSLRRLSQGLPPNIPGPMSRITPRRQPSPGESPVGLFLGCVMDAVYAPTNAHTAELLEDTGALLSVPRSQRCCGALGFHSGDEAQAKRLAIANMEAFSEAETVVVNAAGCGAFLKEYESLFEGDLTWRARARDLASRVQDVHEYLSGHPLPPLEARPLKTSVVTIHDACHLAHAQGVRQPLRDLLQRAGYQVVEMMESDRCCGSAGTYNLSHPAMAERLKQRKVADVPAEVRGVATSNPGCMLQIQAGLKEAGRDLRVAHTVDWLWEAYHGSHA